MGTVSKELSKIMIRDLEKDIENASNAEKELDKYYRIVKKELGEAKAELEAFRMDETRNRRQYTELTIEETKYKAYMKDALEKEDLESAKSYDRQLSRIAEDKAKLEESLAVIKRTSEPLSAAYEKLLREDKYIEEKYYSMRQKLMETKEKSALLGADIIESTDYKI